MFTTFNTADLKALTTQTWVMKPNCSSFGPCSSPTGHCWRGWQSSGKILVSEFNFLISILKFNLIIWFPIKTWLPQKVSKAKIPKLISEGWEFSVCKTSCKNHNTGQPVDRYQRSLVDNWIVLHKWSIFLNWWSILMVDILSKSLERTWKCIYLPLNEEMWKYPPAV